MAKLFTLSIVVLATFIGALTVIDMKAVLLGTLRSLRDRFPSMTPQLELMEDSLIDVVDLVTRRGYPAEAHSVETKDGYRLTMHRITRQGSSGPPVLLMHGFMSSSVDWVINGPETSLAYILYDAGFDVWIGNARGNYYSRNHAILDPNVNSEFWNFSWHEIGVYDMPAMIDHILERTGHRSLHYVGHSQGTTVFFVMTSIMPEYNAKIRTMQAFGVNPFLDNREGSPLTAMSKRVDLIEKIVRSLDLCELGSRTVLTAIVAHTICNGRTFIQRGCLEFLFKYNGHSEEQLNMTRVPLYFSHFPSGVSYKQALHFGQNLKADAFRRYDYGPKENFVQYGSPSPPDYDLEAVTAPVYLYYSDNDLFAVPSNVERLHRTLPNSMGMYKASSHYNHMDFLWADNARVTVYPRVVDVMLNN